MQNATRGAEAGAALAGNVVKLEETEFLASQELRQTIHSREQGRCFYCLRRVKPAFRCLDHVVPQVEMGGNTYRNLVSSCMGCNAQKTDQRAEDFSTVALPRGAIERGGTEGAVALVAATCNGEAEAKD